MYKYILLLSAFIFCLSCQEDNTAKPQLSDDRFLEVLFDVELAREASRTAAIYDQDSLFKVYFEAIAMRYEITPDELETEINIRINTAEDFDKEYEAIRQRADSLIKNQEKLK